MDEGTKRGLAGKQVVEKHFKEKSFHEVFREVKMMEAVLETLEESGIDTLEGTLESVRIAGAIAAHLCPWP